MLTQLVYFAHVHDDDILAQFQYMFDQLTLDVYLLQIKTHNTFGFTFP